MTDCPRGDMRDRLPDLLHGRLDAAARAEVARHVASCRECAAELELLRSMRSALSAAPAIDASRIAAAAVASRGTTPPVPNVRPIRPRRTAARALAWRLAAAVGFVAAGIVGWQAAHLLVRGPAPVVASRTPDTASVAALPPAPETAAQPTPAPRTPAAPAVRRAAPGLTERTYASVERRGLVMDGGVKDLSDRDVEALLQSLDSLTAIPDADPAPMSYQLDDGGTR